MISEHASAIDLSRPVLVVGATGMLGRPVARRLQAEGLAVRVLSRDPGAAAAIFGADCQILAGDVRQPETLAAAVAGCGAVHINLRGRDAGELAAVEVGGVAAIADAAAAAGVGRVTYLSGAGIESADPALLPVRTKRAAEAALVASGVPYTILRASHFMESLDLFVRGNKAVLFGPQPQRFHYLAADDYAGQVVCALRSPQAAGQALTLLGPQGFTMREALSLYIELVRPDLALSEPPLAPMRLVAKVTRNRQLDFATRLFGAFRQIPETGDGARADALVGTATTRLADWCRARAAA